MTICLMLYFSILGSANAFIVKKSHGLKKVSIKMKDKSIFDKKDSFYIGQTNEFLFLHNLSENKSIILNKDEISEISIKTKSFNK